MGTDKILIVDDKPDAALMLAEHFRRNYDCEVTTASSVDEAEALVRSTFFQVIVSDYEMPDRNGGELAKILDDIAEVSLLLFFTGVDKPARYWDSLGYPCIAVLKPDYRRILALARPFLHEL
ncbi:MAG: response regulator [Pseudobdellovibrionaceae bacterium]